jgi:magnesium-transporting ATPase (P-type)
VILMADHLRPGAERIARELRDAGVDYVALVSGDRMEIAREVASSLDIGEIYAEQDPEDELRIVRELRERSTGMVVMAGDGINDAPALALADMGIAMAGKGRRCRPRRPTSWWSSTAPIGSRTRYVSAGARSASRARASSSGSGSPSARWSSQPSATSHPSGALLQEGIDVAVILNALRALRG